MLTTGPAVDERTLSTPLNGWLEPTLPPIDCDDTTWFDCISYVNVIEPPWRKPTTKWLPYLS